MKFILIVVALITLVWGAEFQEIDDAKQRSISTKVIEAIEAAKKQMPCGFPKLGIPPLAPLKINYKEININTEAITIFGKISNYRLDGLNIFDILEFKLNAILSRINFKFNWNEVCMSTDYNLSTQKGDKGMKRSGLAKLCFRNILIKGVAKYKFSLISSKLSLKELKVYVSLGEVKSEVSGLSEIPIINKKLNRIIEEWIILAINDNTDNLANIIHSKVTPKINDKLRNKSLKDLLDIIGGSGDEGDVQCIPPEDSDYMQYFI